MMQEANKMPEYDTLMNRENEQRRKMMEREEHEEGIERIEGRKLYWEVMKRQEKHERERIKESETRIKVEDEKGRQLENE